MNPTREMLTAIPEMAVEAELTRYAPNPSGHAERSSRVYGSRPPLDLDVIDVLRETDGETWQHGLLFGLTQAVRLAWDAIRREDHDARPPAPAATPTWASECGWLLTTYEAWSASSDAAELGMIEGFISDAHRGLRRFLREPRPLQLRCLTPGCLGVITPVVMGDGKMYAEQCDEGHFVDRHEAVRRAESMADMPLADIAELTGVPYHTLYEWARPRRGRVQLLRPRRTRHGRQLFRLEDARRLVLMRAHSAYRIG